MQHTIEQDKIRRKSRDRRKKEKRPWQNIFWSKIDRLRVITNNM